MFQKGPAGLLLQTRSHHQPGPPLPPVRQYGSGPISDAGRAVQHVSLARQPPRSHSQIAQGRQSPGGGHSRVSGSLPPTASDLACSSRVGQMADTDLRPTFSYQVSFLHGVISTEISSSIHVRVVGRVVGFGSPSVRTLLSVLRIWLYTF